MKTLIRKEIEKILLKDGRRKIHAVFCDARKPGVRMKLCTNTPATAEEIAQIMKLPCVQKVSYTSRESQWNGGYYKGITVRLSRSTHDIKIKDFLPIKVSCVPVMERYVCSNGLTIPGENKKEDMSPTSKTITLTLEDARSMYGKSPEMDKLLLANFTEKELTSPKFPRTFAELPQLSGYWISKDSEMVSTHGHVDTVPSNRNIFHTKAQVRSALAFSQLSQLLAAYVGDWVPDWQNTSQFKYVILRIGNSVTVECKNLTYYFLAFPTKELRDEFYKNHEALIKTYFML